MTEVGIRGREAQHAKATNSLFHSAVKSRGIQAMLEDSQWVSPVRHGFEEPVFSLGPLRINWLVVLYLITSNMFFPSLINY